MQQLDDEIQAAAISSIRESARRAAIAVDRAGRIAETRGASSGLPVSSVRSASAARCSQLSLERQWSTAGRNGGMTDQRRPQRGVLPLHPTPTASRCRRRGSIWSARSTKRIGPDSASSGVRWPANCSAASATARSATIRFYIYEGYVQYWHPSGRLTLERALRYDDRQRVRERRAQLEHHAGSVYNLRSRSTIGVIANTRSAIRLRRELRRRERIPRERPRQQRVEVDPRPRRLGE